MLFATVIYSQISYADFALIQDRDGEVNVRATADLKAPVIAKLKNNVVVDCLLEQASDKFCLVSAATLKDNGYVYKDRVNFFKAYHRVALSKLSTHQAIYSNKEITVSIAAQPARVDPRLFKQRGAQGYYNNKIFFGTDGTLPQQNFSQLQQMTIVYQSKQIKMNAAQLEQYFFPTQGLTAKGELADFQIYYLDKDIYILNTFNQGGAAAYHFVLHFKEGKLVDQQAWKAE